MIAASLRVKLLAGTTAVAVHGVAFWGLADRHAAEMEGQTGAAQVSLGNSFADMVAGQISHSAAAEASEPAPPTPAEAAAVDSPKPTPPLESEAHPQDTPERIVAPEPPEAAQPRQTARKTQAAMPEVQPRRVRPETTQAHPAPLVQAALAPQGAVATQEPEAAKPVVPQPAQPYAGEFEPSQAVQAADPPHEAVEGQDQEAPEAQFAPTASLRPEARPAARPAQSPRADTPRKSRPQPQQAATGNAAQNATRGAATGSERVQQTATTTGQGQSQQAGNAAASNYPGLVMRKISRVSRPRVGARGAAVVAFTIRADGGLGGVSLARSSGSAQLDRAALTVVQRAAPFPRPPAGARRSFSITIKGG